MKLPLFKTEGKRKSTFGGQDDELFGDTFKMHVGLMQ